MELPVIQPQNNDEHYVRYLELISKIEIPEFYRAKFLNLVELIQFSNLTKEEIKYLALEFSATKDLLLMTLYQDQLDDTLILHLNELEDLFYIMLKRSEGGFERKMQVSQYQYHSSEQKTEQKVDTQQSQGFLRKLFKF